MKKAIIRLILAVLMITLLGCFCACSKGNEQNETEKKIRFFEVNIPDKTFVIGEIDFSEITVVLHYSDGTESGLIPVTEDMISDKDLAKLSVAGAQPISIVYPDSGKSVKITLRMVEPEPIYYTVTITDGYVSAVNEKALVSPDIPAEGEVFRQEFEKGTRLTIHWIDVPGRNFESWTADDVPISNNSIIDVTVEGNVSYHAYDSAVVNTVSFELGIREGVTADGYPVTGIKSKATDILNAADVEQLDHDEYVFVAWTTDEITYEQAISGYSENLVHFPYRVSRDVVFYGVWTPRGLRYAETDGGYAVSGFSGNVKSLVIPSKYNGADVVRIERNAFFSSSGRSITELTIPGSVRTIESGAFRACAHIENFFVKEGADYKSVDGVLYSSDLQKLISYPAGKVSAKYVVSDETGCVDAYAFYGAVVGSIILPQRLYEIGDHAFDSVHVDSVDFYSVSPVGLTAGSGLFNENLSLVRVADNARDGFMALVSFGNVAGILKDITPSVTGTYTAVEADGNTSVTLYRVIRESNFENSGETAEILGVSASVQNYVVQKVTQDAGRYPVSSLASNAFDGCDALAAFRIPIGSSLERICDHVFDETKWFAESAGLQIIANGCFYKYFGSEKTVAVDTSITKISEGAFRGNTTIEYLDITYNANLKAIMAYAFYECNAFRGFICTPNPSGDGIFLKMYVEKVGAYAFYRTAITGITMQDETNASRNRLSSIGEYAFGYCDRLLSAQLSSSLRDLADTAFVGCYALQKFVLRDSNDVFIVYDGILYRRSDNGLVLNTYPSGRMDMEFDPNHRRNYVTAMVKDENDFIKAGTDGKVGSVYFNGVRSDLFLGVATSVNKATLETTSGDSSGLLTDGSGNLLTDTTYATVGEDGVVHPNGEKYFYFYDSDRKIRVVLYDRKRNDYYCEETLAVGSFAGYSFYFSNIAALLIPESVQEICANAVNIPGLVYARYVTTPISTYEATLATSDPEFVITPEDVTQNNLRGYFQNNQELLNAKSVNTIQYEFFFAYSEDVLDESVLYAYDKLSETNVKTHVVRTSRTATDITIPLEVYYQKGEEAPILVASVSMKKSIRSYAFYGGMLRKVYLRGVDSLRDHAFSGAYALTELDLNSDFIATVGENVFGEKLNDGLYLYDYHNGIDLYYSTESWGLSFFEYVDAYGNRQIASKYLIRSEDGAFAVVTYENEHMGETVDVLYGRITENDVSALQSMITKQGYDISTWTDFDGNIISVGEEYVIPYNIILVCNFRPQSYTVYLSTSPSIELPIDGIEVDISGYVTYVTTVTYDAEYDFSPSVNESGRFVFWRDQDDATVEISGIWSRACDAELRLHAVFGYKLIFEDETVEPIFVFNGESFVCEEPAPLADSVFAGWFYRDDNGVETLVTDADGNSLQEWALTDKNEYYLYAKWEME